MASPTLEDIEPIVTKWLADADAETLTKVCAEIPLTIPTDKAGKRLLILKLLLKYLYSDDMENSDDSGLSTFLKIHSLLESDIKTDKIKPEIVKNEFENGNQGISANGLGNIALHRLREFKINGTVGGVDQKDTLSYTSLSFQMKRGREAGYGYNESEHLNKQYRGHENSAKLVDSNSIQNVEKDKKDKKENSLLIEIQKLTAKVNQLSSIPDEMAALKKQFANTSISANNQNSDFDTRRRRFRRRFRCTNCEQLNTNFCYHCFLCGSTAHRKNACPNNEKN